MKPSVSVDPSPLGTKASFNVGLQAREVMELSGTSNLGKLLTHPFLFIFLILTIIYRMDLHEDAEKNLVTATFELPGMKKEDINIDVHNGRLTVSAESKISEEHEESGYAVRERRFGKFSRTLQLPQGVKVC